VASFATKKELSFPFPCLKRSCLVRVQCLQVLLNQPPQLVAVVTLHVDELHAVAIGSGIPYHGREMDLSKS